MNIELINQKLESITNDINEIKDPKAQGIISVLLNIIECSMQDNKQYLKTIQSQRDEINKLKGEQGKPSVRPQTSSNNNNHSSDDDRNKRQKKKKKKPRKRKKDIIKPNRSVILGLDTSELPSDIINKGYKSIVIQDIKITVDNIEFFRQVYYSPSQKKTFIAPLPKGYEGEYGPGLKSIALSLYHDANITQPALKRFFNTAGVIISASTVSRILTDKNEIFHLEKEDIVDAGFKAPYQQIDDTSARINGKNHYVHILCNPFYTAYFTRPKKDRLTLLEILCREDLKFELNQESFALMLELGLPEARLHELKGIASEGTFSRAEIDAALLEMFPNPKKQKANRRRILEASALVYYRNLDHALKFLMCDDAAQFNLLALHKALCWIHDGRHYKKLRPLVPAHIKILNDFSEKYWDFYQKLLEYTESPTKAVALQLEKEFDDLFSTKTGYDLLDKRIAVTLSKKEELLLPLQFPFLPLHNNESEGGAQYQARSRDIHLQTKNEKGTKAKDTFGTIVMTARKLGVNVYDYIQDRITGKFNIPSLASLILEKCAPTADTS